MSVLTDAEKVAFLRDHIPYRVVQLMGHPRYQARLSRTLQRVDYVHLRPGLLEITFIAGRVLMEFLGVDADKDGNLVNKHVRMRAWDVKVTDLDVGFLDKNNPSDLSPEECDLLGKFMYRASKAAAHLTWKDPSSDHYLLVDKGANLISGILQRHLYTPKNLDLESIVGGWLRGVR